ncbi:MAG: FecR domain-containing protein [Aestuariibacter sp.]
MSNVIKLQNDTDLIDQTGDWIAKMDRGLTAEEESQLRQWLAASPEHKKALLSMAKMWDDMNVLNKLSALFPEPPLEKPKSHLLAMAASVVLASMLIIFVSVQNKGFFSNSELIVLSEQKLHTGVGDSKRVLLTDGSELLLNTESELTVTYTNMQRILELAKGEFHITVAKDSERPLTVYAAGQVIQAVGTAFNVELNDGDVELLVTEGTVRIAKQIDIGSNPIQPDVIRLPEQSPALEQGQISILTAPSLKVENVMAEDIQASLSWRSGNLVFRGEALAEVIKEVSRYNPVSFELKDPMLKDIQVAGLFRTNDLQGFLSALEQNFDIEVARLPNNKVQLRKRI